ncbi:Uncharacterized protein Rs2_40512 [Raphanus sativus]|uniref:Uncharacterized protein LOC130500400 n=1 Tax=Raphanus sativus TaxID=3726 RepID=A0A9W3CIU3_RAPSA|nr:uncharacterized protein LOC130500400 [Raphanus sativus]KAJ4875494.1 Uncharacterized protein Rs2_40512 [Raphanus sativus]
MKGGVCSVSDLSGGGSRRDSSAKLCGDYDGETVGFMSDWRWNPGIEGINDRKETEDLWDWEKGKIKIRRGDEERGSRGDSREDLPGSRLRNRILGKYQRSGDDMDRFVCIITESQQIKALGALLYSQAGSG